MSLVTCEPHLWGRPSIMLERHRQRLNVSENATYVNSLVTFSIAICWRCPAVSEQQMSPPGHLMPFNCGCSHYRAVQSFHASHDIQHANSNDAWQRGGSDRAGVKKTAVTCTHWILHFLSMYMYSVSQKNHTWLYICINLLHLSVCVCLCSGFQKNLQTDFHETLENFDP